MCREIFIIYIKFYIFSLHKNIKLIFYKTDFFFNIQTPPWAESDNCESCSRPFLWNIAGIFERKQFGSRQHHCRSCGRALCDKCSQNQSTIPLMGFELPVRVCKLCSDNIE